MDKLSPQNLANTAWASARLDWFDMPLFVALAKAVDWRVSNSKMQELANVAWAYAKTECSYFTGLTADAAAPRDR